LVDVCRLALACRNLPDNGGDRPQVVITIDIDHLREETGAATLDDGAVLSPTAARRLACDARILPAVLVVLCYVVLSNGRLQRWHAPTMTASRSCSSRSTA
jgi:hypothetical protein